MVEKQTEKVKIYLVIGLAIVFLITAYLRFGYKKSTPPARLTPSSTPVIQTDSSQAEAKPSPNVPRTERWTDEPLRPFIRNIFAPETVPDIVKPPLKSREEAVGEHLVKMKEPAAAESTASEQESLKKHSPPVVPSLKLMGTIIDGKKSMAIINDRFVREGDSVGEYIVEKIGKRKVVLRSDRGKVVLEILRTTTTD